MADHLAVTRSWLLTNLPGLGVIPTARILGEFGTDANRDADANARKAYAATSVPA